jgi:hypothetical protein
MLIFIPYTMCQPPLTLLVYEAFLPFCLIHQFSISSIIFNPGHKCPGCCFCSERSVCAALKLQAERRWPLLKVFYLFSLLTSLPFLTGSCIFVMGSLFTKMIGFKPKKNIQGTHHGPLGAFCVCLFMMKILERG